MHPPRELIVRVERREYPRLVARAAQLTGERLDVARHPTRIGPRIRRQKRDSHAHHCIPPAGEISAPWDNRPRERSPSHPRARAGRGLSRWHPDARDRASTGQRPRDGGDHRPCRAARCLSRGAPGSQRPLRRARARNNGPAALGEGRRVDLRPPDHPLRRAPADAARRSSRTTRKSSARPRASRARRSPTCAPSPSTPSPANWSSTAWVSSPTSRSRPSSSR